MTVPSQAASNVNRDVISPTTMGLVMIRPPPPAISNGTVCFVALLRVPFNGTTLVRHRHAVGVVASIPFEGTDVGVIEADCIQENRLRSGGSCMLLSPLGQCSPTVRCHPIRQLPAGRV